jgi:hypothetical protein
MDVSRVRRPCRRTVATLASRLEVQCEPETDTGVDRTKRSSRVTVNFGSCLDVRYSYRLSSATFTGNLTAILTLPDTRVSTEGVSSIEVTRILRSYSHLRLPRWPISRYEFPDPVDALHARHRAWRPDASPGYRGSLIDTLCLQSPRGVW